MTLRLRLLEGTYAVCRLGPDDPIPGWAATEPLSVVARTRQELSIVCLQEGVPEGVRSERDWRALAVAGPLDFGQVGVLAGLTTALAEADVSLMAISTFDTDYLLVRARDLAAALDALAAAGHRTETAA